jgi:hypothetical protein
MFQNETSTIRESHQTNLLTETQVLRLLVQTNLEQKATKVTKRESQE